VQGATGPRSFKLIMTWIWELEPSFSKNNMRSPVYKPKDPRDFSGVFLVSGLANYRIPVVFNDIKSSI
jgi:hypothetical protein